MLCFRIISKVKNGFLVCFHLINFWEFKLFPFGYFLEIVIELSLSFQG